MSEQRFIQRLEWLLQRTAKPAWFLACVLAVVTLALRFSENAQLQVRIESTRAQEQGLELDNGQLDRRASRLNDRVQSVAKDVSGELQEKHNLHLAMAEVLTRARGLQEQRDRFQDLRKEIQDHLNQMGDYYAATQRHTGAAQP